MSGPTVHGETVLWEPSADAASGPLGRFLATVASERGIALPDYRAALAWSTADPAGFWDALRRWFDVVGDWSGPVLEQERMPGAVWFPQARLNYAENLLRHANGPLAARTAIVGLGEEGGRREISWRALGERVASAATSLRRLGVQRGDRVAAVLPNVPEAVVGLLATASIGATWCICSPDLSVPAVLARLRPLGPTVLIGSLGYRYGGRWVDRRQHLDTVLAGLPSVTHVVEVGAEPTRIPFADLVAEPAAPDFARLPFDHPLWVLFTSGTTGAPKGIVHGHGGMTLEALKLLGLHFELTSDDRYHIAANTSWMVWNTLVAGLLTGASIVTYSGSPTFPHVDRQFDIVAREGVTMFGAGAAYLAKAQDAGLRPADEHDLSALRTVMSTGSTLADRTSLWLHEAVRPGVRLADSSGGTDICSAFVGGNPLEPVRLGRMQGALLGVALEVFDEHGLPVRDAVGELVVTRPLPAMPVAFWADPDGARYRASYFDRFPGVWTHGDWITLGADGTCEVLGRSDATLNRAGVRLGSSEIYGALQGVSEIRDSLVIGVDLPTGGYWLPLFVVLSEGVELDDGLRARITAAIRAHASARHVPDEIITVPAIPMTHAGKKVEVPVKKLFSGADPRSVDRGALANPDALDWFVARARQFRRPVPTRGWTMASLNQVALCTADIARTARILTEVLGFADAGGRPRWGADAARIQELPTGDDTHAMMWWLVGRQEFVQLELFHHTSPPQRPRRPGWRPCDLGWVRFGVVVDDFDATVRRLHEAGLATLTPPATVDGGRRVCFREPGADAIVEIMEGSAPGPALGYAAASVADLEGARRYFGDAFGLEELEPDVLHRPEHERCWGLDGARRTCAVFRAGDALLEVVQYEDPAARPPAADALLSDQGIMNAALGYRDRAEMTRAHAAATALGATATTDVPEVAGSVYLRLADGLSFEQLLVPPELDGVYGFTAQVRPGTSRNFPHFSASRSDRND